MSKGNPEKDIQAKQWEKNTKKLFTPSLLTNLDQKTLRSIQRTLFKLQGDVSFYLDIRNEQGRGGKK